MSINVAKTYEIGNLGSTPTNFFVGKTHLSSNEKLPTNNNQSVFLFASLTAGKNVRIDQATEKEPQIFIDAKFYDFKPYGYLVNYSTNKDLDQLQANFADPNVNLKTIIDSVSFFNSDLDIKFKTLSATNGITVEEVNDELILKATEYKAQNKTDAKAIKLYTNTSKDTDGNFNFNVNKLIEGNCIKFRQILEFAWSDIVSSSSSSSYFLTSSSSSSSSSESSNSKSTSSVSDNSSSSDSSQSLDCCGTSKISTYLLTLENSFNDPNNVFNFTYTDNCFYSEINPRTFVEKNFSGLGTVESKEINFPVNIYSPSNDTFLWVYDGVSALDSKRINIKYLLIKDNSYLDGVCLTSIKYKKTDNSLYSHELRTPSDYVYTAYNNITLEIPINNFSQEGYPVSYSNLETIENVVTSNVNLIIDTEFNNNFNSYNLNSSAFQLQSISTLSNSYKLIYSFDEGSNTGNSGIVEIVVTKCPALSNSQELVGTLIISTQSCCNEQTGENPLIREFSSESSDSSSSSNSSSSSSSNSSSSSSSSSSISSNSSSSSSSRDTWPPINDVWTFMTSSAYSPITHISGNKSYAYAGELYSATDKEIIKYDPISNSVSKVSDYPLRSTRSIGYTVFLDNKIYCGSYVYGCMVPYYSEFYSYDLQTGVWSRLADRPGASYQSLAVATTDNNIIMIIGEDWAYECYGEGCTSKCSFLTKTIHYYNPNTGVWYDGNEFPDLTYWYRLKTLTVNNTIYGLATQSQNNFGQSYQQIWPPRLYKFQNGSWSYLADAPLFFDFYFLTWVNYYGTIYMGAQTGPVVVGRNWHRWYIFDPDNISWTEKQYIPGEAWASAKGADTIGRYIYGFWGSDVWRYG